MKQNKANWQRLGMIRGQWQGLSTRHVSNITLYFLLDLKQGEYYVGLNIVKLHK